MLCAALLYLAVRQCVPCFGIASSMFGLCGDYPKAKFFHDPCDAPCRWSSGCRVASARRLDSAQDSRLSRLYHPELLSPRTAAALRRAWIPPSGDSSRSPRLCRARLREGGRLAEAPNRAGGASYKRPAFDMHGFTNSLEVASLRPPCTFSHGDDYSRTPGLPRQPKRQLNDAL